MVPYKVGQRDLITKSEALHARQGPSQQKSSLLEAEQDEEEQEEAGETERRER